MRSSTKARTSAGRHRIGRCPSRGEQRQRQLRSVDALRSPGIGLSVPSLSVRCRWAYGRCQIFTDRVTDPDVVAFLREKRIFPDVNVLLLALLADDSHSALLLAHCRSSTVVLSEHVLDTARSVLNRRARHLLATYHDSLLQLLTRFQTEMVESSSPRDLPDAASDLNAEDRQILADALESRADILFSLDGDFLESDVRRIPEIEIRGPGDLLWPGPLGDDVAFSRESWTFMGWFIPEYWSSGMFDRVSGDSVFFIFEAQQHVACFYEAHRDRYVLEWDTESGARGHLFLRQPVERSSQNFVFVVADADHLMLFVNGETRERQVRLGPLPSRGSFSPFNDAAGTRQINGAVHFRVVPRALPEHRLRRHFRASTLWLTDDEIELQDLLGPLLEYGPAGPD